LPFIISLCHFLCWYFHWYIFIFIRFHYYFTLILYFIVISLLLSDCITLSPMAITDTRHCYASYRRHFHIFALLLILLRIHITADITLICHYYFHYAYFIAGYFVHDTDWPLMLIFFDLLLLFYHAAIVLHYAFIIDIAIQVIIFAIFIIYWYWYWFRLATLILILRLISLRHYALLLLYYYYYFDYMRAIAFRSPYCRYYYAIDIIHWYAITLLLYYYIVIIITPFCWLFITFNYTQLIRILSLLHYMPDFVIFTHYWYFRYWFHYCHWLFQLHIDAITLDFSLFTQFSLIHITSLRHDFHYAAMLLTPFHYTHIISILLHYCTLLLLIILYIFLCYFTDITLHTLLLMLSLLLAHYFIDIITAYCAYDISIFHNIASQILRLYYWSFISLMPFSCHCHYYYDFFFLFLSFLLRHIDIAIIFIHITH